MAKPCDVLDYQRLARRRVPRMFYDYADSGSWTESTYRANASDFDKLKFRQRVAVDMSDRNLATTMVGQQVTMPLALAPTGLTGLQWADAIIVSNHGGRQLDGAPSTIEVLPSILGAVGDDLEVHIDGGIHTGQALLKALCLGAKSTYIGRPFLYGLGAAGEAGVSDVLRILRNELDVSLALCGERDIQNVGRHNLYNPGVFSR